MGRIDGPKLPPKSLADEGEDGPNLLRITAPADPRRSPTCPSSPRTCMRRSGQGTRFAGLAAECADLAASPGVSFTAVSRSPDIHGTEDATGCDGAPQNTVCGLGQRLEKYNAFRFSLIRFDRSVHLWQRRHTSASSRQIAARLSVQPGCRAGLRYPRRRAPLS